MKHVLVTGGAGFIGSHLTESLLNDGYAVRVVDNESTGRQENLAKVWKHPHLEYIPGTVTDPDLVRDVVQGCQMVFHLAASVGVALVDRDPIETVEQNIR
ncbi:MAG: SDR family NAD(P)-dependent oxidoreductase, partial [Planctomycetota bacterium]|nr:SDR family NAD(P)-dependent oxidoreductase [Planctomycetota bacterium]